MNSAMRDAIRKSAVALAVCSLANTACPADQQPSKGMSPTILDLRDARWRDTRIVDTGTGAVQYIGDAATPGGIVAHLQTRLQPYLEPNASVSLKTADIRLSIPNVRTGITQVLSDSAKVELVGTLIATQMSALMSVFERNKSASAVFCLSIDGKDYLGNDAHLFRTGAESELQEAIESATNKLIANIKNHSTTDSPACMPGWEGGQARDQ